MTPAILLVPSAFPAIDRRCDSMGTLLSSADIHHAIMAHADDLRQRTLKSAAFAAVMGIIAVYAAWVGAAVGYAIHGPPSGVQFQFAHLTAAIEAYHTETKSLPDNLSTLNDWELAQDKIGKYVQYTNIRNGVLKDPWGNPIQYTHGKDSFIVTSYGADGKPGGEGIDEDLTADKVVAIHESTRSSMTFMQFLAQPRSKAILIWCAICALMSWLLSFVLLGQRNGGPPSMPGFVVRYLVTAAFSAFFTYFMALLEIVKYH